MARSIRIDGNTGASTQSCLRKVGVSFGDGMGFEGSG